MSGSDPIASGPTVLAPGTDAGAADGAGDRLEEGASAGDYVVDRHVGAGAMGDVYAGHHPVIGKRVAIKVIKRSLARSAEAATRFLREARAGNHVDHPGVVDVFAIGRLADGRLFLVMDLLDGRSLRERLRAGPVPVAVARRVLGEIAAALDAAHARGVIHRDLKPDNVMLTGPDDAPTAHVLDFGIARLVADSTDAGTMETLTGQGTWLGTPAYMAPEQWSADGATAASDRYALGIIAYELLTGRVPFAGGSVVAMMEQHFRAPVPTVTSSERRLPAAVDRVLGKALAKEPGERYPSAAALVAALDAALAEAPGRARPAVGRAGLVAGVAAGAVMVAGVVVIVAGRGSSRRGARAPEPGASVRKADEAIVEVTSSPPGARVVEGGRERGVTPLVLTEPAGRELTLDVVRPGYVSARRVVTARAGEPAVVDVALALVSGFEGVWSLPDGGGLRAFERRGEQVAGFTLKAPGAAREFLRFFDFVPAPAGVTFAATEPFVDERAPQEPSCHIPLRAEYTYEPAGDRLELRRERAQYALVDGRCQLTATTWSEPRVLARVAGAPADAVWAESRAGAGALVGNAQAAPADGAQAANQDKPAVNEPVAKDPGLEPSKPIKKGPTRPTQGPASKKAPPAPTTGGAKGNQKAPPGKEPPPSLPPPAAQLAPAQNDDDNVGATMKKSTARPQQQAAAPAPVAQAPLPPAPKAAPQPQVTPAQPRSQQAAGTQRK